jgi:hypothetical protein
VWIKAHCYFPFGYHKWVKLLTLPAELGYNLFVIGFNFRSLLPIRLVSAGIFELKNPGARIQNPEEIMSINECNQVSLL